MSINAYPTLPLAEVLTICGAANPFPPEPSKRPMHTTTIAHARKLIAESAGRLTWLDAGEQWARVTLADPGVEYPVL